MSMTFMRETVAAETLLESDFKTLTGREADQPDGQRSGGKSKALSKN